MSAYLHVILKNHTISREWRAIFAISVYISTIARVVDRSSFKMPRRRTRTDDVSHLSSHPEHLLDFFFFKIINSVYAIIILFIGDRNGGRSSTNSRFVYRIHSHCGSMNLSIQIDLPKTHQWLDFDISIPSTKLGSGDLFPCNICITANICRIIWGLMLVFSLGLTFYQVSRLSNTIFFVYFLRFFTLK